ncbi:hypothetical protein ACHAXT_002281 [Thalassiosira profunda]
MASKRSALAAALLLSAVGAGGFAPGRLSPAPPSSPRLRQPAAAATCTVGCGRSVHPATSGRSQLPPLQSTTDSSNDGGEEEARRLQEKAAQLRDQIKAMESEIGEERRERYAQRDDEVPKDDEPAAEGGKSLANKRVLILGANGRLGSMVTRYLLRTHPEVKEVVAAVHYVGQATTRGYGRLSYEVGAEDGVGTIGAAWSGEDERNASFIYGPETMAGYNLNKLRIVEVELLDPVQVRTITEDVDSIIFCATDFEGNRPRAVASLNAAFLFRAVAAPTKGRVEIEGLRNCLEGLAGSVKEKQWKERLEPGSAAGAAAKSTDPTQFVLVSTAPDAFGEFETPFGEFNAMKRQGERILMEEFPSVSSSVLQLGKFDDNFVEEGQEIQYAVAEEDTVVVDGVVNSAKRSSAVIGDNDGMQKRINRRDAAMAAVEALLDEELEGKKTQVFTAVRKTDIW